MKLKAYYQPQLQSTTHKMKDSNEQSHHQYSPLDKQNKGDRFNKQGERLTRTTMMDQKDAVMRGVFTAFDYPNSASHV